jgi:hypothetical protein
VLAGEREKLVAGLVDQLVLGDPRRAEGEANGMTGIGKM